MKPRSAVLLILVAAVALTGCSPEEPSNESPGAASPSASSAGDPSATSPEPAPAPAVLVPDGTAADNLPLFTEVVAQVWAGPDQVAGRAYVDALVAAGYERSAMQVTPDTTTIGNPAESIEFSVRWGEECLVGQVGPSIGSPVTTVLPGLSSGGCLIGQTRAIDW